MITVNPIPRQTTDGINSLDTLANKAFAIVKATRDKKNPPRGIEGYVFTISEAHERSLESDATDHYVEDNTAMQDHIALRPETVTLSGLVAEVATQHYDVPGAAKRWSDRAGGYISNAAPFVDALPPVGAYLPNLCNAAQRAYNEAEHIDRTVQKTAETAQSAYDLFAKKDASSNEDRQTKAFNYFRKLWSERQLVTVETPWGVMENMAIISLRFSQDPDTRYVTNISITLKKIRIADTITAEPGQLAGRAEQMKAEEVDNGNAGQLPVDRESALFKIKQWAFGR